jgi:hypothetical protein
MDPNSLRVYANAFCVLLCRDGSRIAQRRMAVRATIDEGMQASDQRLPRKRLERTCENFLKMLRGEECVMKGALVRHNCLSEDLLIPSQGFDNAIGYTEYMSSSPRKLAMQSFQKSYVHTERSSDGFMYKSPSRPQCPTLTRCNDTRSLRTRALNSDDIPINRTQPTTLPIRGPSFKMLNMT